MPMTDKKHSEKGEVDDQFWLDKQCLEPIISVPDCSRLCNACLWVLQQIVSHKSRRTTRHVEPWTTLSSSADRGCQLCIYLRNQWYKYMGNDKETGHIVSHALAFRNGGAVIFYPGEKFNSEVWSKSIEFDFLNPACESHFTYDPIQVAPRHSNSSS